MGSMDGMKEKADAKKKVLVWLFLIYLVVLLTIGVFMIPILRRALEKGAKAA